MTNKDTAILIDAENISVRHIDYIFKELHEKNYDIKIRRAFADWSEPGVSSDDWKKTLNKYAIRPTHLFNFTNGKNASDIQLVIFGMKTLYENPEIQNFIIVTSDSDFTPFALSLKESGKTVIGYGGESASSSLKNACDHFTSIKLNKTSKSIPKSTTTSQKDDELKKNDMNDLCYSVWLDYFWLRMDTGWFPMDIFGQKLKQKLNNKTWKACGYKSLKDLIHNQSNMETQTIKDNVYVRPVTMGGDWVLPAIQKALKAESKVMTDEGLELNKLVKIIGQKTNNDSIAKELILSNPLYECKDKEGQYFMQRKMSKTEKKLNSVFVNYCKQYDDWTQLNSTARDTMIKSINEAIDGIKDLANVSLSNLAKSCCCIHFKHVDADNGKRRDYYIKNV